MKALFKPTQSRKRRATTPLASLGAKCRVVELTVCKASASTRLDGLHTNAAPLKGGSGDLSPVFDSPRAIYVVTKVIQDSLAHKRGFQVS